MFCIRLMTSNRAREELPALLEAAWHALRGQGDLARARSLFDHAARLAEAQGVPQALGGAALGAGGFWLHEQRSPVAQALVSGWRRTALAEVDPAARRGAFLSAWTRHEAQLKCLGVGLAGAGAKQLEDLWTLELPLAREGASTLAVDGPPVTVRRRRWQADGAPVGNA